MGERHDVLAPVAGQLPFATPSAEFDAVAHTLDRERKPRPVERRGPALRAVDFQRFERAPGTVRPLRHVGDDDVSVELRIGGVALFRAAHRRPRRQMVETGGDHIAGGYPLLAAPLPRLRIRFEFGQRRAYGFAVGRYEPRITTGQSLNAHRLGRAEGGVPTGAALLAPLGLLHQNRAGARIESTQHRHEVLATELASELERLSRPAEPLPHDAPPLTVVVILSVLLVVIGLGLAEAQPALRHHQHGLDPLRICRRFGLLRCRGLRLAGSSDVARGGRNKRQRYLTRDRADRTVIGLSALVRSGNESRLVVERLEVGKLHLGAVVAGHAQVSRQCCELLNLARRHRWFGRPVRLQAEPVAQLARPPGECWLFGFNNVHSWDARYYG